MSHITEINAALQAGNAKGVKELISKALDDGAAAETILNEALLAAMDEIGVKFKNNEVYVPEVLIAARAMNAGLEQLKPHLGDADMASKGTAVVGTVKGDLHDIGKNLVKMMMESKGLKVIDLGTDVEIDDFINAAKENDADIIGCSALLTTTMMEMKRVVEIAKSNGLKAKVMIGGAPISQAFCDSIGADGYAPDATSAAEMALEFCK